MGHDARHPVQATQRSFEVLEALAEEGPLGVTELTDRVDLSKGAVHNHLATLEALGYVTRSGTRYAIAMRFLYLGRRARERVPRFDDIEGELTDLQAATGEVVSLFVVEGDAVTCALSLDPHGDHWFDVGDRFPLAETAAGRAALSELPDERAEQALEAAETDREAVSRAIERARENGVVFSKAEHGDDHRGVAAPVTADVDSTLVVDVSGDTRRLTGRRIEEDITGLLISTVKRIEIALGEER